VFNLAKGVHTPLLGVPRTCSAEGAMGCCTKDGGRSSAIGMQRQIANRLKVLYPKGTVLNV